MNLSLNPKAFSGPLRFEWFVSEEGSTWQIALNRLLSGLALDELEQVLVEDLVGTTLERIGKEKFRRHFEIRPISMGQSIVELRWLPHQLARGIHLRLYAYLDVEGGLLLGLCFRQKVIGRNQSETNQNQNQDILRAINLALQHKSQERDCKL
jgi:hypothetical protein